MKVLRQSMFVLGSLGVFFFFQSCAQKNDLVKSSYAEVEPVSPLNKTVYEKKTQSSVKKKSSYKRGLVSKITLGPFFKGKAYVPYQVKVEFETQLHKIQAKHKSVKRWKYVAIGYVSPEESSHSKKMVLQRVRNIIEYAIWKGKIDENCFKVKIKTTKKSSLYQQVDIFVYIDK